MGSFFPNEMRLNVAKKPKVKTTAALSSGKGYWLCGLRYNKSAVVEADSEASAIQAYKEVMGIRSSDHEFKAEFLPDGYDHLELDDYGVVIGDAKPAKEESDADDES